MIDLCEDGGLLSFDQLWLRCKKRYDVYDASPTDRWQFNFSELMFLDKNIYRSCTLSALI